MRPLTATLAFLLAASHAAVVYAGGFAAIVSPPRFELASREGTTMRQVVAVTNRSTLPARIDRVDIGTGRTVLWREIAPADRTGMITVASVLISDDESTLSYSVRRLLSELYLVEGLR